MATPTPGKHASGAVATPPVSTPFSASNHPSHPAFSPHGPRSVQPSPQQVKKSPATSNTMYGYPGGGHPTNSSFGVTYDSPSTAMALGGVSGLDLNLDGIGVPGGMGTPLGGVGHLAPHSTARGDEDERRRKLAVVMDTLKGSKGRLSEAGIQRLARREGLESIWDSHTGSGGNLRTLIIAGSALALDIDFNNNIVKKVALSFPGSPEVVTRHTDKAGDILLRDLEFQPHESPLTKKLDRFAANLERLAQLDKLSIIPGFNCHEAIAGIYESLEKLHTWEVERLKEGDGSRGKDSVFVETMAMCTKSGKPVMHTRDRLGMSLDYWQEKRLIPTSKKDVKIWSLLVECAPSPGLVYTPLRVSRNWIAPNIQKVDPKPEDILMAPSESGIVLDWLEPDNTLLPATEPPKPDAMEGLDNGQKLPEVMFIAKFDPPLIMPYSLAAQIYNSTGASLDIYQQSTFDGLMFPHAPEDRFDNEGRVLKRETSVPIFTPDGGKENRQHKNELWIPKIDYGRKLTELPFSHPRHLVEILPSLRQYSFLSTLLLKSFGPHTRPYTDNKNTPSQSKMEEFESFMRGSSDETTLAGMNIVLATQPDLRLSLVFPFRNRTANVSVLIKPNAAVEIVAENVLDGERAKGLVREDLGRMLEMTEDLGIWSEFVKRRLE